ncbi:prevent-host-death family protein [Kitasatospora sp. NPDC094019]
MSEELPELEDEVALARYRARQAAGTAIEVPHEDVRSILGLERE